MFTCVMEEQDRHTNPQRRRSRSAALHLVAEFEQSGLSRRAFCQQRGISPSSLDNYRKIYQREAGTVPSTVSDIVLVPVDVIDRMHTSKYLIDACWTGLRDYFACLAA